jgi:glucose-1-phosphate adenylyltransferase
LGEYLHIVPPQHSLDEHWYCGTADAVYQNIFALEQDQPKHIVILSGDHIYKMNYQKMIQFHDQSDADLTIAALRVTQQEAGRFGIMQVDKNHRLVGFEEKPTEPQCISGSDDMCLASMGIYVFKADFLFNQLCLDASRGDSSHDFGKDIIPSIINSHRVFAFPFRDENRKEQAYWRDVGNIDAFYEANMDLVTIEPQLNLYDSQWPILTHRRILPPPKFVFSGDTAHCRVGQAHDSMVGLGSIISGGTVKHSVVGRNVRVDGFAQVDSSILFDDVHVGERCTIRRAILDTGVTVPPGASIGVDLAADRLRGCKVTDSGITVVTRGCLLEEQHSAPVISTQLKLEQESAV